MIAKAIVLTNLSCSSWDYKLVDCFIVQVIISPCELCEHPEQLRRASSTFLYGNHPPLHPWPLPRPLPRRASPCGTSCPPPPLPPSTPYQTHPPIRRKQCLKDCISGFDPCPTVHYVWHAPEAPAWADPETTDASHPTDTTVAQHCCTRHVASVNWQAFCARVLPNQASVQHRESCNNVAEWLVSRPRLPRAHKLLQSVWSAVVRQEKEGLGLRRVLLNALYWCMMNHRIGWLQPEHQGPAFDTWKNIQEGHAKATSGTAIQAVDFIPLTPFRKDDDGVSEMNRKNTAKNNENTTGATENVPVAATCGKTTENGTPWVSKDKYSADVVG